MTDFFQAEFNGTGNLTAYTPEIGAALAVVAAGGGFIGPPYNPAGYTPGTPLADLNRATAGSWVATGRTGWPNPPLYTSATPPGLNYYLETEVIMPSDTGEDVLVAHYHRGIRGTAGEALYFDAIGAWFDIYYSGGSWKIDFVPDSAQDRSAAVTFVSWDSPLVDTGTTTVATSTVTLRTELEGFELRGFINGTLVYQGTYSGTTYFNAAGKVMWQFYLTPVNDGVVNTVKISAMRAGSTFLVIPPPVSAFWTEFVKTEETLP